MPVNRIDYFKQFMRPAVLSYPDVKALKIAIIGCPNSGKSSLVNMLVGWRVCAHSSKAHTTRSKQVAVFTQENIQLI
ncbi:unnamed protein product [Protopolystoma xenopodis]|uniref:G domain-containing protein n=1 Tax=Protopolystoma xenopodis TaxID=117903 RepID=A0A448WKZ4_9PLAT|nr:unnamed protein product [Protopolystoma xenopodis]